MYKCKYCGKEFENRYKLTGHVTHCKLNPNYNDNLKKCINNIKIANNANIRKNNNSKDNKTKDNTEYNCIYCGKICIGKNSLKQHEIRCKENPNRIPSNFIKYNKEREYVWNKGLTKETDERIKKQSKTIRNSYKSGKIVHPNLNKKMSDEQKLKISKARIKFLKENPDKIPYLLNHSSNISYPEQYFIKLFENENINLKYHKQIGLYQLDFYNEDVKFYIEIDGEQHYQKKSIERDKKREEYLSNLGWTGKRIRWSTFKKASYEEKQNIIKDIINQLESKI